MEAALQNLATAGHSGLKKNGERKTDKKKKLSFSSAMDYVTRQMLAAYSYFTWMAAVFTSYPKINVKGFQSFSPSV